MNSIFDQDLDKNPANYVALSPTGFVERSAEVFGDLPAVATPGRRHVSARRAWPQRCVCWACSVAIRSA